jgi:hypothetical protein
MTNTPPVICVHNLGGVGKNATRRVCSRLQKKVLLWLFDLAQELMDYLWWHKMVSKDFDLTWFNQLTKATENKKTDNIIS